MYLTFISALDVAPNMERMWSAFPSCSSQSIIAAFAVAGRETAVRLYTIVRTCAKRRTPLWLWLKSGVPPWNNEQCQRDVKFLKSSVNPKPSSGGKNTWHPPSKQVRNEDWRPCGLKSGVTQCACRPFEGGWLLIVGLSYTVISPQNHYLALHLALLRLIDQGAWHIFDDWYIRMESFLKLSMCIISVKPARPRFVWLISDKYAIFCAWFCANIQRSSWTEGEEGMIDAHRAVSQRTSRVFG